ncbi:MAG: GTP 3',8-cyclase MoaA [Thermodesulfobacteriota bacterium]|nr:GTP 3',8-cyclase MoaA [Thermodesulfobacteriota bacterium]
MDKNLLTDGCNRRISYLRVSITDRCNLNCIYCRPGLRISKLSHDDVLSYEEIQRIITIGAGLGIDKVRITGGEPLVRQKSCDFLETLGQIRELSDISITTNGLRLENCLARLQRAGVRRVNISLDTLNRKKFARITGVQAFDRVWAGIMAALDAGLNPVKLNMVVMRGINDDELADFARLTIKYPLHVRFIELMPVAVMPENTGRSMLAHEIRDRIAGLGDLTPLGSVEAGGTAERFAFTGARGELGFISPVSRHFCRTCNRLRLTADGKLKPCLLSDTFVDIKGPLRVGATDDELAGIFREAVCRKPGNEGASPLRNAALPEYMSAIGG